MKEYGPNNIRNLGLVSHQSIGKTTLAEAMLFSAGAINRMGTVDDGSTASDYRADEIDRKISITTSLLQFGWDQAKINCIDMPGYPDFIGEVKCGLRVCDLAVILLNGLSGPEVGTEIAWEIIEEYHTARLFFVNLLNREHADFDKAFSETHAAYGNNVVAVQFPVNQGEGFHTVIDVLRMKQLVFKTDGSGVHSLEEIPGDLMSKAEELRNILIEKIAESDDDILEKYFDQGELSEGDIVKGLRSGIANCNIYPVLCGAASANIGVRTLLDFITEYGPSPQDAAAAPAKDGQGEAVEVNADTAAPAAGLIFKTLSEMHVGELSLIRLFNGQLKSGDELSNTDKRISEKIGQIYSLLGRNRNEVAGLVAGDIGALVKLKDTHTGDTLADKKRPLVFEKIVFPEPVVQVAVVPKSKGDEEKISNGLHTLQEMDPSFSVEVSSELKQTVVAGQGEMHLTVIIQRLKERFGVDVEQKKPKIPYRETITGKADEKYRHKKQTGGAGQFAEVWMRIEPQARGEGFIFESQVVGGAISSVFIPSIEKGIRGILGEGALAGYQIVDVKAVVYDGKEHPVDSKDIAFQIAGREVFKMAFLNARPILLEPIYEIGVKCPEVYMGDIMGDLSSRRGKIQGMEAQGRYQIVKALVPLAELHNYATTLRSITHGRATHTRKLSHYDPVPKEVEAKIIEESKADKK